MAAALIGRHVFAAPTLSQSSAAVPMIPDYTPSNFVPAYDHKWCPANTTAVYIPPVFAYYPFAPNEVYKIVGSFVNITWISPAFNDTTYVGKDNTPGGNYKRFQKSSLLPSFLLLAPPISNSFHSVIRTEPRDPFGAVEVLFNYATDNSSYGFYHQQAAHVGKNIQIGPGLLETDSHAVLQMMPACDGIGTSWGFYLTYCLDKATMASTPGFNFNDAEPKLIAAITGGTSASLQRLWTILDGDRKTPFNATSCEAIQQYRSRWGYVSSVQ